MRISFVIPTKDRPDKLATCLQSLSNQNNRKVIDKVIVVACGERLDGIRRPAAILGVWHP